MLKLKPKPTQFGIQQLLVATFVLALVFALARLAGYDGSIAIGALLYVFGPTIAFLMSRYGRTRNARYAIAGGVLFGLYVFGVVVAAFLGAAEAGFELSVASFCCWGPQIAFLYVVYLGWKSGLRSAGIDPDRVNHIDRDEG
ncbi:hypothetical protein FYK55_03575 [Roseiconus nitratireducens]|uniref:Uncharacterized protein n=1 Tax=Roseiconus nitratireducens TaxID=2605748 RepID=A0A5M6DIE3_9BACT|nr:hypothetical protein [Roseiconus nitratireducens]KAA5546000.1 hypothetical protein FYK55_03575 [Roseiconus nitratireducens]